MESELVEYEVKSAMNYSIEGKSVNTIKLLYFQRELAMDSRYSFKVVDLLKYCNAVYIEYKSKRFIYMDDKVIRI